jgi:Ca2+-transporting ATPase
MSTRKGKPWHALSIDELCELLHTDRYYGLTNKLAKKQRERFGENTLFSPIRSKPADAFRWVLRDAPLMLLLLLCVVALCFSMWRAVVCVLAILGVSITLTVTAHTKTQHIKESMNALSIPRCEIIRGGKVMIAKANTIVVGDCLRLHAGDRVPADVRLVSCDADF